MEMELELTTIPATEIGVFQGMEKVKGSQQIKELLDKVTDIKAISKTIRVKTDEDEKLAIDSIGAIKVTAKGIEEVRQKLIAAPSLWVKSINGMFKVYTEALESGRSQIMQEISKYQYNKKVEAQRAQDKANADLAKMKVKLEKQGVDPAILPEKAPEIITQSTVRAESATSYTKKVTDFELVDFMALVKAVAQGKEKIEALQLNESYVRGLIKAGVREIAGIRIVESEQTIIRGR